MRNHWVMDYETLANTFVAVFIDHKNDDNKKIFIVNPFHNDQEAFMDFISQNVIDKEWHISYNGLAFDGQITHWVLANKARLIQLDGEQFARAMYEYAQYVINKSNRREFLDYPEWKMKIKQIDVFKLNHWDNPAKSSSLKWIQYSMDWYNVEEMPIHHTTEITTQEQVDEIVSYCINDVMSTKAILYHSQEQITLRASLSKEYNLPLLSASEPRISKELFAMFLCNKLGWEKSHLKQMRTYRHGIVLSEIILSTCKFKTPIFQSVLDYFMSKTVVETKKALEFSITYKGVKTDYGLGGIHGCKEAGIYEAQTGWTIMTSDVTSFYPNLAIKNGFAPEHLPKKDFLELYEWFFTERQHIPKSDPKNYVYKIVLNSTYGLSNDENCFLYDPKMTMQITINGQLQLSMLYEMLAEGIPESIPLMQNTDGLEMMIPMDKVNRYMEICKEWETITSLQLEHDEYKKLILRDVNNYIAVSKSGKTKCKGFFEWEDLEKKKVAVMHKNKSFLIIPKAIYAYFVHGTKPEDFLAANQNLFDYCGAVKGKGNWGFETRKIVHQGEKEESVVEVTKLQKLNRYFISKDGQKIVKVNQQDGREIQVQAGKWKQTIANNISLYKDKTLDEIGVNTSYYLEGIYKEINNIDNKVNRSMVQAELF